MNRLIMGKNGAYGKTPSVLLINPKYTRNVGAVLRACSCFGAEQLWFTGDRILLEIEKGKRLPREERMKGYLDVELIQNDYPFDQFKNVTPVAIEVRENSEPLTVFEHPENALYVFGPEDGSINQVTMKQCHRIVSIPTKHCTNLAAAVYIVLYDRYLKRVQAGLEPAYPVSDTLCEQRGWPNFEEENIIG